MKANFKKNWRVYLGIIVGIAAIIFIYLQWDKITASLTTLKSANWLFIALSIVTFTGTVLAASVVIYSLRMVKQTKYSPILLAQASTLFLARITPASVGGLAAMARALVVQKHSVLQAGSVVAAGSIATFVGNVILSTIAILLFAGNVQFADLKIPIFIIWIALALIVVFIILMLIPKIRQKVKNGLKQLVQTLSVYKDNKKALVYAVFYGFLVTLFYGLTMMLVAYAVGVHLSLLAAIITISLGSLGVAVTPLPGGAVGAEAAIAATLSQFGVSSSDAIAIALVYRAVTFWLPLLPGFIASQYALKNKYL